ncbi:MAG: alpha/beta hydrolase [Holophagales bacterium]|nr:alpha/beta hydrolase [Holophagales bacterium]
MLYVQDGQQFRIQIGRVARVQAELFGEGFNLVGVPGRIFSDSVAEAVTGPDGSVDWEKAYLYYRSRQWCGDLDAVRRQVLGEKGRILLYGRSGGALLAQECLARYPENVDRVYLQAALNPKLEQELGVATDPFWSELGTYDPDLQKVLRDALKRRPDRRPELVRALSRQHFFVDPDQLGAARAELVRAIARGDEDFLAQKLEAYQVNAIRELHDSPRGIAIRVRQYEFFQPVAGRYELDGDSVSPTPEMQRRTAAPLLRLHAAGRIEGWDLDLEALGRFRGEVFLLAGALDVAVPPAYQERLASLFPKARLFLARDDHMMKHLQEAGVYLDLHRAFLAHGGDSPEMNEALKRAQPWRWEPAHPDP